MLVVNNAHSQTIVRYDSTGNPKAKGLSVIVKHPSDWIGAEGERPNIVQKFVKKYPTFNASMMLQILNLPPNSESEIKSFKASDWREVLSDVGEVSNVSKTQLENQDAYIADIHITQERAGLKIEQKQRVLGLFYKNKWIWLWCGVGGLPSQSRNKVEADFKIVESQCFQFYNSLVLLQKYTQ